MQNNYKDDSQATMLRLLFGNTPQVSAAAILFRAGNMADKIREVCCSALNVVQDGTQAADMVAVMTLADTVGEVFAPIRLSDVALSSAPLPIRHGVIVGLIEGAVIRERITKTTLAYNEALFKTLKLLVVRGERDNAMLEPLSGRFSSAITAFVKEMGYSRAEACSNFLYDIASGRKEWPCPLTEQVITEFNYKLLGRMTVHDKIRSSAILCGMFAEQMRGTVVPA